MESKVLLLVLATLALCAALRPERVMFSQSCDSRHDTCRVKHWRQGNRPDADHPMSLTIAVKQKNTHLIEKLLTAVSDPDSSTYGQYLSFEEIGELTRSQDSVDAITKWLNTHNIEHKATQNGEFVRMQLSAKQAEMLLDAKFFHFHSKLDSKRSVVRTHRFTLPLHVAPHVDFISHTTRFPSPHQRTGALFAPISFSSSASQPNYVTPQLLYSVYNIQNTKVTNKAATQSVFESLNEYYSEADLQKFQSTFKLPRVTMANIIGPNNASNPGGEASLDVQYMLAVAGAPTTFWSTPSKTEIEPFLEWILAVSSDSNAPLVHSVSYGDSEASMDQTQIKRFNTEVGKLGLRGLTVVVSSGDDGVADNGARDNPDACGYNPSYPASCPYITSVGATQGPEDQQPEVACSADTDGGITTGGGFSLAFPRPSYQADVVSAFLASDQEPSSGFNSKGRGYPDVSMLGHAYVIFVGGQAQLVSGTSASAPVFGAVVTLMNNARLNAGKPPMGFVNPFLYKLAQSNPDVFNDITQGNNNCAAQTDNTVCCDQGFNAIPGWDAVTGLGSVNVGKLLSFV